MDVGKSLGLRLALQPSSRCAACLPDQAQGPTRRLGAGAELCPVHCSHVRSQVSFPSALLVHRPGLGASPSFSGGAGKAPASWHDPQS